MTIYTLIRNIIFVILVVALSISISIVRARPIKHKGLAVTGLSIAALGLYFLSLLLPLEHFLLTFPTAEEAFHCKYDKEIKMMVEGEESVLFVVHEPGKNEDDFIILSETERGWTVPHDLDRRPVSVRILNNGTITLFRYKDTQEYYLYAAVVGKPSDLYDNRGTEFKCIGGEPDPDSNQLYSYCAYLRGIDEDYILYTNGKAVQLVSGKHSK